MSTEIDAEASAILTTWFGSDTLDGPMDPEFQRRWFAVDPAFDRELGERFGALVESAAAGRLLSWEDSARGALALVLLLDQFTRNVYRGSAQAFAADPIARRSVAERAIARRVRPRGVVLTAGLLLLPFEHAEELALQDRSVALFQALAAEAPPSLTKSAEELLSYAEKHRAVITRFRPLPAPQRGTRAREQRGGEGVLEGGAGVLERFRLGVGSALRLVEPEPRALGVGLVAARCPSRATAARGRRRWSPAAGPGAAPWRSRPG